MKLDKRGLIAIPRLREWREERVLTRKALAEKSKVTISGITKIELGKTKAVHVDTAKQLAKALGIAVDKLALEESLEKESTIS